MNWKGVICSGDKVAEFENTNDITSLIRKLIDEQKMR